MSAEERSCLEGVYTVRKSEIHRREIIYIALYITHAYSFMNKLRKMIGFIPPERSFSTHIIKSQ